MRTGDTQYELMQQGKSYYISEYLYGLQKQCARMLSKINTLPYGNGKREKLLKKLFGKLGDKCVIKEGLRCNYGFNISIGDNCFFNYGLTILDSYKVEIGSNVFIAPNVIISPVTHPLQAENRRNLIGGKIVIEDDVWIGAGAVILPGVRLARGAVVAAGAVVKSDVREYEVVGGIPAKHIKNVNREGEKYGID